MSQWAVVKEGTHSLSGDEACSETKGVTYLRPHQPNSPWEHAHNACPQKGDNSLCRLVRNGSWDWDLIHDDSQNQKTGLEMAYDSRTGKKLFRPVGFAQQNSIFQIKCDMALSWLKQRKSGLLWEKQRPAHQNGQLLPIFLRPKMPFEIVSLVQLPHHKLKRTEHLGGEVSCQNHTTKSGPSIVRKPSEQSSKVTLYLLTGHNGLSTHCVSSGSTKEDPSSCVRNPCH